MPRFKVGDIVVGNARAGVYSVTHPGSKCEIVQTMGPYVKVRVIASDSGIIGAQYTVDATAFNPVALPNLDPARPVTTRTGLPVVVRTRDDPERPFEADVNGRTLTFTPCGRFHPAADSPVDLVNG